MEKIMGLNFVGGGDGLELWQGKPRLQVVPIDKRQLSVSTSYIKYLNVRWKLATNWVLLTESGY